MRTREYSVKSSNGKTWRKKNIQYVLDLHLYLYPPVGIFFFFPFLHFFFLFVSASSFANDNSNHTQRTHKNFRERERVRATRSARRGENAVVYREQVRFVVWTGTGDWGKVESSTSKQSGVWWSWRDYPSWSPATLIREQASRMHIMDIPYMTEQLMGSCIFRLRTFRAFTRRCDINSVSSSLVDCPFNTLMLTLHYPG